MSTIEFTAESDRIVTAKSGRPRGFIDWKPRAASQKLLDQIDAVLAEYIDQLPLLTFATSLVWSDGDNDLLRH